MKKQKVEKKGEQKMKWTLLPWRRKAEKKIGKQEADVKSLQQEIDDLLIRLAIVELGIEKLRHDHDEHIRRSRKKKAAIKAKVKTKQENIFSSKGRTFKKVN